MNYLKKQKFSLRKLSVGLASVCVGCYFLMPTVVLAEEQPTGLNIAVEEVTSLPTDESLMDKESSDGLSPNLESAEILTTSMPNNEGDGSQPQTSPTGERIDPNKTPIELLEERQDEFNNTDLVKDYSKEKKQKLLNLLSANFDTKADNTATIGLVKPKTHLGPDTLTAFKENVAKLRKEAKDKGLDVNKDPLRKQLADKATKITLADANNKLYEHDGLESLAVDAKPIFEAFLRDGLLSNQQDLTIAKLKKDLPALVRGTLYLQQQFNFEEDLPKQLVFEPESLKDLNQSLDNLTPYQRLLKYGGKNPYTNSEISSTRLLLLSLNQRQFETRGIKNATGFNNATELIEKLAQKNNKNANDYFLEKSEAIIGTSNDIKAFDKLKAEKPDFIIPLIAQGKGVYAGITSKTISIGRPEVYEKDYNIKIKQKLRGQLPTDEQIFFKDKLMLQENYLNFLETIKKKEVPFSVAIDSQMVDGKWPNRTGKDEPLAIRRFFEPMNLYRQYDVKSRLNGVSESRSQIVAYSDKLMAKNNSGITLYTHELTHSNDQETYYGGKYPDGSVKGTGRRAGQGPEVYARGLFEAIDNTQKERDNVYIPVFNINTAIPIMENEGRVQAKYPLKSKEILQKYMTNLVDLIAYLEAKEAEVALNILNDTDKNIYSQFVKLS